jgi:hypothetical protein
VTGVVKWTMAASEGVCFWSFSVPKLPWRRHIQRLPILTITVARYAICAGDN